ncbi:sensor histidine kinase [Pedobacter nyackensis]|uniref:sensor histidine kinase n=1 Tax=Pedobacter nyackensis TaxID=475255 RepID=UPI00292F4A0F|nr:histidine kinase [Pedobacter nyackensis]
MKCLRKLANEQKKLLDLEKTHQQELLENMIASVEIERTRIARDFHDQVGNIFSLLSLVLQQSEDEKIQEAKFLIDKGLNNTRELIYQIMPPELKLFGLEYALEEIFIRVNKSGSLIAKWLFKCELNTYNLSIQLSIYRIIQELVSNTIKHSNANQLTLTFSRTGEEMQILYKDNGTLQNDCVIDSRKGYGLRNIETRVQLLSGSFDFNFKQGFESNIIIKSSYAN